ncbi:S-layer homology domain-containing protein [Pseudomonadota bacterium]
MRKLAAFLVLSVLLLSANLAYAGDTEPTTPAYNDYTLTEELNFTATLNDLGKVDTTWDTYIPTNFNYYKVVRSQENSDPVYPDDGYIFVGGEGDTSYTDTSVPAGTSYYRVCSIAKPDRFCSPVVTIDSEGGTTEPTEPVDPAVITLEGSVTEEGKVDLSWTVDDESLLISGFKIAYSKSNEEPVYPGDSYVYLDDNVVRSHLLALNGGYTYYIRVCQYDGAGNCVAYSNMVSAVIDGSVTVDDGKVTYKADDVTFVDTTAHWAEDYADKLKDTCGVLGYKDTDGVPTGYFDPDSPITRAELAKMIINCAHGELAAAEVETYPDVDPSEWYAIYVYKAKKLGWVEGYDDGTFKPNNSVNRAEALKMILASKIATDILTSTDENFSDIQGNEWYVMFVSYAVANDIVDGYSDGTFGPDKAITRAEVAKILSIVYML